MNQDKEYMELAIALAKRGEGWCHPNPKVGAVIVKDGQIIGQGYHARCGQLHAERAAIKDMYERVSGIAGSDVEKENLQNETMENPVKNKNLQNTKPAQGATMFVTLEPCCHYGKQPPCVMAIVEEGITKVVVGSRDPNPKVAGGGVKYLRDHGVEVVEDFMRDECDKLNPVFFHYITTGTPYVVMKYAMTADGKIATVSGKSKWITGEAARQMVQYTRHSLMGIMVGIGTVLADDPMLNCRLTTSDFGPDQPMEASWVTEELGGKSPVRIICDSRLRIPLDSQIVKTAKEYPTIVACGKVDESMVEKQELLIEAGVQVISCPGSKLNNQETDDSAVRGTSVAAMQHTSIASFQHTSVATMSDTSVNLKKLMEVLGQQGIDSILLEGGGTLNQAALASGIVNHVQVYVAPKIFGGQGAKSPVAGAGVDSPDQAYLMKLESIKQVGEDIQLDYEVLHV